MSRKTKLIAIATVLAVLAGAASAYAALNTYKATLTVAPSKAGSVSSPSPAGYTQNFTASAGTPGNRAAALTDVKTTIYGLTSDGKDFPTCTLAQIAANKSDSKCPKGALVASGGISAVLGPESNQSTSAPNLIACKPMLHLWNAGQGKFVEFFVAPPAAHLCGPVVTGLVGPFPGTIKLQGKNLVLDVPVPNYVSFPVPGFEGSLESEHLAWSKMTKRVHGKTVAYLASVACKNGKRPYTTSFTAELGGKSETKAVPGSESCK